MKKAKKTIGFIGIGILGYTVVQRLLTVYDTVYIFNRTASKMKGLKAEGAVICDSVEEVIDQSDGIMLMLSDITAIESCLFTADPKKFQNKMFVQMGTISASESCELGKKIESLKGLYLEAPVLGSRNEALTGTMIVMVAGEKKHYDQWKNVLLVLGSNVRYIGSVVGQAATLKLALNQMIAVHAAGISLSLGLVEKSGVGQDVFMDILRTSALYAPMYDKKLSNWKNQEYDNPNFPIKHLLKDVQLVIQNSKEHECRSDVAQAIEVLLNQAVKQGLKDKDYSSVYNVINNIKS